MQTVVKKQLLKYCVEDIMDDYQRLTPSETEKFDARYGDIVNTASRAVYIAFTDETCVEDEILVKDPTASAAAKKQQGEINFRNIDIDQLHELS